MKDKTLNITTNEEAKANGTTVVSFMAGDSWTTLVEAWNYEEGWLKTTKAMHMGNGLLVQTSSQQKNLDGSYALSDALAYVPNSYLRKINKTEYMVKSAIDEGL